MDNKEALKLKLNQVFSPSSPIRKKDFFYGRYNQLEKVMDAINEDGQHAILYGERGVGKTSLANIMATSYTNLFPVKVTCTRDDSFKSLWEIALGKVQFSKTTKGLGFNAKEIEQVVSLGNHIADINDIKPRHIEQALEDLSSNKLLFIFDEFDNITCPYVRASFADLIKTLSDNNTNTTVILVGIADSIESLIGDHLSLERCLKQVKMPKMKKEESEEIINNGLASLDIKIEPSITNKIIEFSSGFPHYVHLLCKYGAKEIIENEKDTFSMAYLNIAIREGIENTSEKLRISYRRAILSANSSTKWKDLIFACAQSPLDEFNAFTIGEIVKHYNRITGKNVQNDSIRYNLNQLLCESRGQILVKLGKGMSVRYMFNNPMMRAFIKLKINNVTK